MRSWTLCALLSVIAFLLLGLTPAVCPVLADPLHESACDHLYDSTEGDPYESAIPAVLPNISVPLGLKGIVNSMLKRSPTFRRQCEVLNNARNVRIDLRVVVSNTQLYKARSIVQRFEDGFIVMQIQLNAPGDYIEAIGHEFEHAVEQSEGLNLKSLASARRSQVYEVDKGTYETERAIHAGHIVAEEYYSRRHR